MSDTNGYPVSGYVALRRAKRDEFSEWCRAKGVIQADEIGKIMDFWMGMDATTRSLVRMEIHRDDYRAAAVSVLERITQDGDAALDAGYRDRGPARTASVKKKKKKKKKARYSYTPRVD